MAGVHGSLQGDRHGVFEGYAPLCPRKCLFFKGGYMKKIDNAFAPADPAHRYRNDTGEMARAGDPRGLAELSGKLFKEGRS